MRGGLDLDAPIVPGKSAGGCHIGQSIEDLPALDGKQWPREPILDYRGLPTGQTILRSDAVDLWVTQEHVISQIGVHGAYRGKLFDWIGLGMTIDDIERLVGPCAENIEDNLSIYGIRGFVFDVEWRPHQSNPHLDFQLPEASVFPIDLVLRLRRERGESLEICDHCTDRRVRSKGDGAVVGAASKRPPRSDGERELG